MGRNFINQSIKSRVNNNKFERREKNLQNGFSSTFSLLKKEKRKGICLFWALFLFLSPRMYVVSVWSRSKGYFMCVRACAPFPSLTVWSGLHRCRGQGKMSIRGSIIVRRKNGRERTTKTWNKKMWGWRIVSLRILYLHNPLHCLPVPHGIDK